MIDKIGASQVHPLAQVRAVTHNQTSAPADARLDPAQPDTLSLSQAALDLRDALQAVQASPEARESKVADLQARIDAGTYQVPAEAIARKLLGD